MGQMLLPLKFWYGKWMDGTVLMIVMQLPKIYCYKILLFYSSWNPTVIFLSLVSNCVAIYDVIYVYINYACVCVSVHEQTLVLVLMYISLRVCVCNYCSPLCP